MHEAANPRLPLATEAQLGTALRYPSLLGRREPGRAKMADGLEWHAVFRPFYLGHWCHSKLLGTVFSLALHGLEEGAFVVTQECRVFLAKRFCFLHVRCLLITGTVEESWPLNTWETGWNSEKKEGGGNV